MCSAVGASASAAEIPAEAEHSGEGILEVKALVADPSWREATELPRLRVFLDDEYRQDILLVPVGELFTYHSVLGWIEAGTHAVRLDQHGCSGVELESVSLKTYPRSDAAFVVLAHSPFLYLRPDSVAKCSDIPLLMWHELVQRNGGMRIRYTVLFSNEDGGTPAPALMACWGRTTDIEWVYMLDIDEQGNVIAERYQGPGHSSPKFRGTKLGNHPLFGVRTTNNMVDPVAEGEVRVGLYPLETLAADEAREAMMDRHPWTFHIMAEELHREGKIESVPSASTIQVSDPRNYLYCDVDCRKLGRGEAAVEVVLEDGRVFRSDHGMSLGVTSRHGIRRAAVELPPGTSASSISRAYAISVTGSSAQEARSGTVADKVRVQRCFVLGSDWNPMPSLRLQDGFQ
jgi:hypothetical protein